MTPKMPFHKNKNKIRKVKGQMTKWEEIIAPYVIGKDLIHEEFLTIEEKSQECYRKEWTKYMNKTVIHTKSSPTYISYHKV